MNKDIDFIKATRYASGGGANGVNFFRRTVSKVGNSIAKKFINLPVRYSFLTFEHSEGRENSNNQKIQDKGFQVLTAKNYYRIAKDVLLNNLSTEDWYIDLQAEEFLNTKVINALKESSNVEYLELTDIAKKNFSNKK